MKKLIKEITSVFGPSGDEEKIRKYIKKQINNYVDNVYEDNLGNLIAVKKGKSNGKKIMFAAHMDQIALMITHIDEDGFLRFTNVGGVGHNFLPGTPIVFADGTIGTIGVEKLENINDLEMSKLYIDIGANNQQEAEKIVGIGDTAIYAPNFSENNNRVISNYHDDRIGCVVLIEAIKNIQDNNNELYFVFSTQEEVGLRGAKTAAYQIEPDIGIAVDVTATGDTPESHIMDVSLGEGAAIKIKDNSTITHPLVKDLLIKECKNNSINYQFEVLEFGGTDAGAIHLTKGGIPSGTISIPTRYVHTPTEMVDLSDVKASIELVTALSKSIF
ncbi:MAG TPA: M42 family metallopeptidase [Halanaerobiales bacterium]|nr:M42 family metallopeptidase [Halanaerobiales bacterium]